MVNTSTPLAWATFDAGGHPTAFYVEPIWDETTIPSGAVSIPYAAYEHLLENQGKRCWNGLEVVDCQDPRTPPLQPPFHMNEYFLALGKFVAAYSSVEAALFILLQTYAGVEFRIGQAIFSGTRSAQARSFINRIREARRLPDDPSLKDAFDQLSKIEDARNLLLHYGHQGREVLGGMELITSNTISAFTTRSLKELQISPEMLANMEHDISAINARIMISLMEFVGNPAPSAPIPHIAASPWRYKPVPPTAHHPSFPPPSSTQSAPRQRDASPS